MLKDIKVTINGIELTAIGYLRHTFKNKFYSIFSF